MNLYTRRFRKWQQIDWNSRSYKKVTLNWRKKILPTLESPKSMRWSSMHTFYVSNARSHTLEEEKIVWQPWTKPTQEEVHSSLKNWFVQDVVTFQFKIVPSMAKISSNSSANSVAVLLSGSVGATPTSASHATSGSAVETMWVNTRRISCQNARVRGHVQSEGVTTGTGRKRCWVVRYAEISKRIIGSSDACEIVLKVVSILIKTMDKLFSLFIRYSLIPEKEFIQRASKMIYSAAELAESKKGRDVKIRSQPDKLSISSHHQKITLIC